MNTDRRTFIRQLCFTCGSIAVVPACTVHYPKWRFFTEQEADLVIAIAEQFIPADKDPGATDAHVINYIDRQLAGPYTRFREDYRQGLHAFENSCQRLYDKKFTELEWAKQTAFLEQMEEGELPDTEWRDINQGSFFRQLLDHAMQGFYGSPRHGGNANYVSYKMMRIDYPHVIGQNRYGKSIVSLSKKAS